MKTRASFIVTMAILLAGLPACARREQQRSQQAASDWGEEQPSGGVGHDLEARERRTGETAHEQAAHDAARAREASGEMEDLDNLGAQDEATRQQRVAEACPVSVEGAEVRSREVPNGVALIFTTEGGDVDELRSRVDRFAQLHNEQSAAEMPRSERESAEHHEQHAMHGEAVPSRAEVEQIDGGAQIILTPRDPSQLSALRQEAQRSAQQMAGGECPVMGGSTGG